MGIHIHLKKKKTTDSLKGPYFAWAKAKGKDPQSRITFKAYVRAEGINPREEAQLEREARIGLSQTSDASRAAPAVLRKHPMWGQSDYDYFVGKGYTDKEILALWGRDARSGNSPVQHKKAPDVVGVVGNKNFYKGKDAFIAPPAPYGTKAPSSYIGKVIISGVKLGKAIGIDPSDRQNFFQGAKALPTSLGLPASPNGSIGTGDGYKTLQIASKTTPQKDLEKMLRRFM